MILSLITAIMLQHDFSTRSLLQGPRCVRMWTWALAKLRGDCCADRCCRACMLIRGHMCIITGAIVDSIKMAIAWWHHILSFRALGIFNPTNFTEEKQNTNSDHTSQSHIARHTSLQLTPAPRCCADTPRRRPRCCRWRI